MKLLTAVWLASVVLVASPVAQSPEIQALPEGPGRPAFIKLCVDCHALSQVLRMRGTRAEWTKIIDKMVTNGAEGTDAELDAVLRYTSSQFGKPIKINLLTAAEAAEALGITAEESATLVKYRDDHGKFTSWEDLAKVTGVPLAALEDQKKNYVFDISGNGIATVTAHLAPRYQ